MGLRQPVWRKPLVSLAKARAARRLLSPDERQTGSPVSPLNAATHLVPRRGRWTDASQIRALALSGRSDRSTELMTDSATMP
jgi:hypothetical protein